MSDIAESFASSLSELTVNSKPHINMLTMLAEDHLEFAPIITQTVLTHLQKVPPEIKLPVLYLIDSIVKNVGKAYINLFTQSIVQCFTNTFEKVDEKTREQMFKLRQTWSDVFPAKVIYALDAKVHQIDPAWPVPSSAPSTTVHLNPKFFKPPEILGSPTNSGSSENSAGSKPSTSLTPEQLREQMIMKQKMLLELQQQKLKLELLQTQAQLEEQQKQLEKNSPNSKTCSELSKLQVLLKQEEEKLKALSKNLKKHVVKLPATANRQHIQQVTSDMKASKVTDLSKVTGSPGPESLVKPAALLELNKDSVPHISKPKVKEIIRPAPVPSIPKISHPLTMEKQKAITQVDSTEEVVPPVRIAPVSSQLINAALSFGRNVRDPRIRQMSSRLESQLNSGSAQTTIPPNTSPTTTHAPSPPIATVPVKKPEPTSLPSSDNKAYEKGRKEKRSNSQHHRDRPSKSSEEESKTHSRSSYRSNERSSTRSRDKEKSSPSKRSEDKNSRRAKIDELFSSSRSKSPSETRPASSSLTHSPSKSNTKREQTPKLEVSELTSKSTNLDRIPKKDSSPKRTKLREASPQIVNNTIGESTPMRDSQKLSLDIGKAQIHKESDSSPPKISPEPMDSSAEMLDEDIEKIVKNPGIVSKLKQPDNKPTIESSQESLKSFDDSIEDNFEDIVKHPHRQFKFDRIIISEEKIKSVTFEQSTTDKTDKSEIRKSGKDSVLNVTSPPYQRTDIGLKDGNKLDTLISDKQNFSKLPENLDYKQSKLLTTVDAAIKHSNEKFQEVNDNILNESYLKTNYEQSNKSQQEEVSSSTVGHDFHETYIQEEVVSTIATEQSLQHEGEKGSNTELSRTEEASVKNSPITQSLPVQNSQSNSLELSDSGISFMSSERLSLSPANIQSPSRNLEPMETIVETNENTSSGFEQSSPIKPDKFQASPIHQDKKFRKGDKLSIMEQVIADAEKHEASPSPPPPPVISDKFKEIKQSSLSRLRRVGRSREDLTGTESPEPEPADVDLRTQIPPPPPLTNDLKNEVSGLSLAEKDVDLRNLPTSPSKKRPSMEKLLDIPDIPPAKKSKSEVLDELFGSEDVDLRPVLCPPPPSPPPPPVISTSPPPSDVAGERLWARYKQTKPDTYKVKYTPTRRERIPSVDKLGRQKLSGPEGKWSGSVGGSRGRGTEDVDMRPQPPTSDGSYNHIIIQAMEQHKRGDLDNEAYKRVLSEVFAMREKQQLEEAQRRDEEAQHEQLEPVSDDDVSGSLSGVEDAPSPPDSYSGGEDLDETLKKASTTDDSKPAGGVEEQENKVTDNLNDKDKPITSPDVDIRLKVHKPRHELEDKTNRKSRGVSPYNRDRRSEESKRDRYIRRREERTQRKEKKAKRDEEERERGLRYRQSRYGQEPWKPHENRESEEMEVDGPPRVPPIPHFDDSLSYPPPPSMHPPPHDAIRPPHWEVPQMMPGSGPGPGPWMPGVPPPVIRGPPVMGIRPLHDRFMPPRWHQPGPGPVFDGEPVPGPRFNRFGPPPMGGRFPVPLAPGEVPPTDQAVLKAIEEDPTRSINIDGVPRDIRFYGTTAVALMSWDDPREISFQPGSRRVIIDDRDFVIVHFNGPPVEVIIDGKPRRLRFGAPTRELFIDNQWYEIFFGGPPVTCNITGQPHTIQLEGPPPNVRPGVPRKDLVVGKITLIIDAEYYFTVYLDARPQKFEVKGVGYIIRFVEALQKTVINGVAFKSDFGGLPRPIILNGMKHFFRLTALPQGVIPGYLTIANMEGGRLPSPPTLPAPPQLPASLEQAVLTPPMANTPVMVTAPPKLSPELNSREVEPNAPTLPPVTSDHQVPVSAPQVTQTVIAPTLPVNPLDMLTTLMPATLSEPNRALGDYNYSVDNENSNQGLPTTTVSQPLSNTTTSTTSTISGAGEINVAELLQKLMATGIVPSLEQPKDKSQEKPVTTDSSTLIRPVDFRKPDSLKVRQTALIAHLYSGIQCNSCGVRFPPEQTMKYSQHLDWHFRQNRRDKDSSRTAQTRRYYYDVSDWIQFEEIEDLEERAQPWFEIQEGGVEEDEPPRVVVSVRAADYPDDVACNICHDKFESFYNEEKEEWHLRNASDHEGKLVHPICLEDQQAAAEKPIVVDDIDITEDESPKKEEKLEEDVKKDEEALKEEEDDDIMEVMDIEYIKPVFPVEDLTVSDNEEEKEEEKETKEEKKSEEEPSEVTSTTNELEENKTDQKDITQEGDEEPKEDTESRQPDSKDEDTQDDLLVLEKGEDSILSNAEIMEVVRNIKKDPDALGGEYEETGLDPEIKKEKGEVPLPEPVVDTTHATVTCLIDGNVEFEEPAQKVTSGPPKIKINITKSNLQSATKDKDISSKEGEITELNIDSNIPSPIAASLALNTQPPPPGEEPVPIKLKEKFIGRKLVDLPPVTKGNEMSGLCSIM